MLKSICQNSTYISVIKRTRTTKTSQQPGKRKKLPQPDKRHRQKLQQKFNIFHLRSRIKQGRLLYHFSQHLLKDLNYRQVKHTKRL